MKEQILCGKEVLIYGDESKDENIMIVDKNTDEILFKEGWINAHHKRHHMFNDFENKWFVALMVIYAIFYLLIALPITVVENKLRYIYEKI